MCFKLASATVFPFDNTVRILSSTFNSSTIYYFFSICGKRLSISVLHIFLCARNIMKFCVFRNFFKNQYLYKYEKLKNLFRNSVLTCENKLHSLMRFLTKNYLKVHQIRKLRLFYLDCRDSLNIFNRK